MTTVSEGFYCFDCARRRHGECVGVAYVEWDDGGASTVTCKCWEFRHNLFCRDNPEPNLTESL